MSAWEWLVAVACIADVLTDNVKDFMTACFTKENLDFSKGVKQGMFWELVTGIDNALLYYSEDRMRVYTALSSDFMMPTSLVEPAHHVENEIQHVLVRFEQEKEMINGRLYWEFSAKYPIKSTVTTMLSFADPATTSIIVELRGSMAFISGRCQDKHENMNVLLQKLIAGFPDSDAGGHIPAAGGHFPAENLAEFKNRLLTM